jgi:pyruvate formate lyase activating enzyme
MEQYSEDDILDFLNKRKNILEGIVISGGEPTMYKDLKDFIVKVKSSVGLKVKLDTNGTNPHLLKELIDEKLIDYVAMDIKSNIDNYHKATGIKNGQLVENIKKSIDILKENKVDYEFRTTIVKGIHTLDDFEDIGKTLLGGNKYYLQNYLDSENVLYKRSDNQNALTGFSEEEINEIKDVLSKYLKNIIIRNI